ncbi:protein GLUTAMINE DUMPER 4-like [Impatiens glandulifera]|uniref:protein GLUTAMINE DUMPER 4-like n=1 Tax=Impatiens glandulifera TaxID=253017 RepID=UPI001FB0EF30|nr:protein GLUTAMINE DUMPER 4-like [Impatiens glandulifera]
MRQAGRILLTHSTVMVTETEAPIYSPSPANGGVVQRSPWHSPLPYLFGGLAAMLGLIAFALLILACSYFKKSRDASESDDLEAAAAAAGNKPSPVFEEKILVIMAGDMKPTFLATPMSFSSKSSYSLTVDSSQGNKEKQSDQIAEKQKDDMTGHHHHQIHILPSPVPNQ